MWPSHIRCVNLWKWLGGILKLFKTWWNSLKYVKSHCHLWMFENTRFHVSPASVQWSQHVLKNFRFQIWNLKGNFCFQIMDQALNRHHAGGKQPRLATSHVQQMERPRRDARSWRKGRTRPLEASSGGLPTLGIEFHPIFLWPPLCCNVSLQMSAFYWKNP